jgi:cell division septal protein FtsQ
MRPIGPKRELPLRREGPRPAVVVWLALAAAAALVGAKAGPPVVRSVAGLARGETFQLRTIGVTGARRVPAREIAAAAGLAAGAPLLDVDVALVERRIADLPAIASARAMRLPPGTLVVGVEERRAEGVVETGPTAALQVVCREGVPFAPASERESAVLPRLRIAAPVIAGEPQDALREAVALARELADAGLRPEEVAIAGPGDPDGAVVRLRGLPAPMVLGRAPREAAIARLAGLVARRPDLATGVSAIDLRFEDRAVLRSGPSPAGDGAEASPRGGAAGSTERAGG